MLHLSRFQFTIILQSVFIKMYLLLYIYLFTRFLKCWTCENISFMNVISIDERSIVFAPRRLPNLWRERKDELKILSFHTLSIISLKKPHHNTPSNMCIKLIYKRLFNAKTIYNTVYWCYMVLTNYIYQHGSFSFIIKNTNRQDTG